MILRMGPGGSRRALPVPSGKQADTEGRYPQMRRRVVTIAIIVFVVMCGMIAWSQWYAIHVNVPKYLAH
jgi:hypothetical protein